MEPGCVAVKGLTPKGDCPTQPSLEAAKSLA